MFLSQNLIQLVKLLLLKIISIKNIMYIIKIELKLS